MRYVRIALIAVALLLSIMFIYSTYMNAQVNIGEATDKKEEKVITLEELLEKGQEAAGEKQKKGYKGDTYRDMRELRKEQIRERLPRELR